MSAPGCQSGGTRGGGLRASVFPFFGFSVFLWTVVGGPWTAAAAEPVEFVSTIKSPPDADGYSSLVTWDVNNACDLIATAPGNSWSQPTPGGPPAARYEHSAVFDSAAKKMYVFGGNDVGSRNDLWVYDVTLNTWTPLTPGGPPSGRYGHSATFDPAAKKMYVFGG